MSSSFPVENGLKFMVVWQSQGCLVFSTSIRTIIFLLLQLITFRLRIGTGFPIENGLKQRDTFLPQLFNIPVEYAITKVQETNFNGIH